MYIEGKISKNAVTEDNNQLYEVLVMILISEISPESCCFANFTVYSISRLENFLIVFRNAKFIQLGTQNQYLFSYIRNRDNTLATVGKICYRNIRIMCNQYDSQQNERLFCYCKLCHRI